MAFKAGKACAVKLGTATVVGMGTWRMPGVNTDLIETTSFGDSAKKFITGLLDYGDVSFEGLYDPADSTGQAALIAANLSGTTLTTVRLYVDNTSYWAPNLTADSASGMLVQSFSIEAEKSGAMRISFSGRATGPWALV